MARLTRGTLPPGVYWRRRLFVLGLAAAVVMLVGGLVRGTTGDTDPGGDVAEQAAAEPTISPSTTPSDAPTTGAGKKKNQGSGTDVEPNKTPLPVPEGPCSASDIVAEPKVGEAIGGRDVAIILKLRTEVSEACRFSLSARALTLKITSGSDEIWASRHCPRAIPEQALVLRNESATRVRLDWNAKRSDDGCTRLTQWALPGWYHVTAAALGGEPTSAKFELERPRAPEPKPSATPRSEKQKSDDDAGDDSGGSNQKKRQRDEKLHRTER